MKLIIRNTENNAMFFYSSYYFFTYYVTLMISVQMIHVLLHLEFILIESFFSI